MSATLPVPRVGVRLARQPAKQKTTALKRERHQADYTILVTVITLVAIGILMVYAGRLMTRFREDGPWIGRWLPLTSSAVMTLLGLGIAVQAVIPWMAR